MAPDRSSPLLIDAFSLLSLPPPLPHQSHSDSVPRLSILFLPHHPLIHHRCHHRCSSPSSPSPSPSSSSPTASTASNTIYCQRLFRTFAQFRALGDIIRPSPRHSLPSPSRVSVPFHPSPASFSSACPFTFDRRKSLTLSDNYHSPNATPNL